MVDQLAHSSAPSTASLNELARGRRWVQAGGFAADDAGRGSDHIADDPGGTGRHQAIQKRASASNFAGLVPVVRDSNQERITPAGSPPGPAHLRGALVEAAWTSKARAPQYGVIFDRVRRGQRQTGGRRRRRRRMLEDAWTMLTREEVFRLKSVTQEVMDGRTGELAAGPSVAG